MWEILLRRRLLALEISAVFRMVMRLSRVSNATVYPRSRPWTAKERARWVLPTPGAARFPLPHDPLIEISLHRQTADFYKLYDDRQAGDRAPSFSIRWQDTCYSIFTFRLNLFAVRFFAFRAFTSAPKVSKPGQSLTFTIQHHPHTFYIS